MKTCFKCGSSLPLKYFYAHPQMKDGHLNKCKECTKAGVSLHRENNLESIQEYDRQRGRTKKRLDAVRTYHRKNPKVPAAAKAAWTARNPEKKAATTAVNNAIRDGRLKKQPCTVCQKPAQTHHDDYSKPLEVRWLCPKHHALHHRNLRDQARKVALAQAA